MKQGLTWLYNTSNNTKKTITKWKITTLQLTGYSEWISWDTQKNFY